MCVCVCVCVCEGCVRDGCVCVCVCVFVPAYKPRIYPWFKHRRSEDF